MQPKELLECMLQAAKARAVQDGIPVSELMVQLFANHSVATDGSITLSRLEVASMLWTGLGLTTRHDEVDAVFKVRVIVLLIASILANRRTYAVLAI